MYVYVHAQPGEAFDAHRAFRLDFSVSAKASGQNLCQESVSPQPLTLPSVPTYTREEGKPFGVQQLFHTGVSKPFTSFWKHLNRSVVYYTRTDLPLNGSEINLIAFPPPHQKRKFKIF